MRLSWKWSIILESQLGHNIKQLYVYFKQPYYICCVISVLMFRTYCVKHISATSMTYSNVAMKYHY